MEYECSNGSIFDLLQVGKINDALVDGQGR